MKILSAISTILCITFACLYFVETMRTEQLRNSVEQRNKAVVTLKSIANGLLSISEVPTDSLLGHLENVTKLETHGNIIIVGTTLPNPERYVWDYFGIRLESDSSRQLVNVELYKP